MRQQRPRSLVFAGALLVALLAVVSLPAQAGSTADDVRSDSGATQDTEAMLERYAADTWKSFVAMTDAGTGLPADRVGIDGERSVQTSTTNIGAYMWSAVVAEELGILDRDELVERLSHTIATLEGMERHEPSGQFFNWYDHRTAEKLTVWPPTGQPHIPRLSSVDNGWLAVGLQVVRHSVPELADRAGMLYDGMDFGFYYQPEVNRILFHYQPSTGNAPCCYDTHVTEARIASYIGIGNGQIPRRHYFGTWRSFPDTCDWSWQQQKPVGDWRTYLGVEVFEGAYRYRDQLVVPAWGGSMFEALMPTLFVPEEQWAKRSWAVNHPRYVQAHIEHGLDEAQYGYWGFSPADVPEGGYRAYGQPWIGMDPNGYPSNNDGTTIEPGFGGCPGGEPEPLPGPADFTNGVVTPHAAFLALRYAPEEAITNLANVERDFDIYTDWGFRDSVNVDTGTVAPWYLALDQGMIMAAIGNHLADDLLRDAFVTPQFEGRLRPVMAMEEFANFRPPS